MCHKETGILVAPHELGGTLGSCMVLVAEL